MVHKFQAILFDRKYFNPSKCRRYLRNNGYEPIKKVHTTKDYYRYRLQPPSKTYKYITINLTGDGVIKGVYILSYDDKTKDKTKENKPKEDTNKDKPNEDNEDKTKEDTNKDKSNEDNINTKMT